MKGTQNARRYWCLGRVRKSSGLVKVKSRHSLSNVMIYSQPFLSLLTPTNHQPQHPLFISLPGMDGTGLLFDTQVKALKHHFDIRCAALPSQFTSSWGILADQVILTIRQEQQSSGHRDIYLCGESFGGCLALLVTLKAPDLVNRLILVNPATGFRKSPWASWATNAIKLLPDMAYSLACHTLLPFLANLSQVNMPEAQALLSAMKSIGYDVAAQRVELLSRFDISDEQYQHIAQPTLIIAGDRDRLLPSVAEGYRLASLIPNAHVQRLPNSGHACLLERDVNLVKIMHACQFGLDETKVSPLVAS